jgi:hypothetical protein
MKHRIDFVDFVLTLAAVMFFIYCTARNSGAVAVIEKTIRTQTEQRMD